jgi:apolipoprotein N-acyltransferase
MTATFATILIVLALVFGILALAGVPRFNWAGAGVVCLAVLHLMLRGW